jgi:predicted nucleic acid binding AN1-type Zn finger protein
MDLHKIQNKKDFVFTKPTIIEQDLSNMANSNLTPISIKKKKGGKKKKKKSKKNRCFLDGCGKKLKLTDMACRCQNRYCQKHRLPESHTCSWNPRSADEMQQYVKAACLDKSIRFSKLESI